MSTRGLFDQLWTVYTDMTYALDVPNDFRDYSIVQLQILNILVALKIWENCWPDQYIEVFYDILEVLLETLQTGKAR